MDSPVVLNMIMSVLTAMVSSGACLTTRCQTTEAPMICNQLRLPILIIFFLFFCTICGHAISVAKALNIAAENNKSTHQGQDVDHEIVFENDETTHLSVRLIITSELEYDVDESMFTFLPTESNTISLTVHVEDDTPPGEYSTLVDVDKRTDPMPYEDYTDIEIITTVLPSQASNDGGMSSWGVFLCGLGGLALISYFRPWWSPFRYLPIAWVWGYARFEKDSILDNPIRLIVYNTIRENPGISEAQLVQETGFSRGAVRYAVYRLEEFDFIKRGEFRQYYSLGDDRPYNNTDRLPHLDQTIIYEIKENHLNSQRDLAKRVKLPTSTMSYRLRRLVQCGLLRPIYWGRTVRYELVEPPN